MKPHNFWMLTVLIPISQACGNDSPGSNANGTPTVDLSTDPIDMEADSGNDPDNEGDPTGSGVPTPILMRLTDQQYTNTIQDILGVTLNASERETLVRDYPTEAHYSTNAESQVFNAQYVLAYANVARSVTERLNPEALLSDFGDCNQENADCKRAFVQGLGLRLFRRPLTADEETLYITLSDDVSAFDGATFDDGVIAIAQAMLQAPDFLYRVEDETTGELETQREVNGYEFAARLSYFLWQSAPDDALLAFAAGPEGDGVIDWDALPGEVDRMMADPRYARSRELFWDDYTLASTASFASVSPEIGAEMRDSLLTTLNHFSGVGGEARPLNELFVTDELWMTPAVAELAGVSSPRAGMALYTEADLFDRIGLLTHPGFIAAMGTTSFVGRGVFMSKRFLCIPPLVPPSTSSATQRIAETAAETEELTPREASVFRFGLEPACQGCHEIFEPIAYAFERYDLSGRYTTRDDDDRLLFTDGVLPAGDWGDEVVFDDVFDLMDGLAWSPGVERCMVQNMLEYSTGHDVRNAHAAIDAAYEQFVAEGRTFDALMRAAALDPQLSTQFIVSAE